MKAAAIDIFSYIVEFSPSMVREFILQEGLSHDDVSLNITIQSFIYNIRLKYMFFFHSH